MDLEALEGAEVDGNMKKLNDVLFFDIIGELGIPCFWNQRECIFHLSYVMTLFSLICSIFCILSVASQESIVMAANWSFGDSASSRMWVGLSGIFWETIVGSGTVTSYIRWSDDACSDTTQNPFCENCDNGGKAAIFLVLMSCTTRLPSMMLLKARMNPISDIPLIKFLGMVSEGLAAICLCGAMFIWREYCHVQLPSQSTTTYSYGSGFYLVAFGFCLTTVLFVIHTLMPTEDPYDDVSLLDEHLACCSAKSRAAVEKEKQKLKSTQVQPEGSEIPSKKKKRRRKKRVETELADEGIPQSPSKQIVMNRSDIDLEKGN